MNKIYVGKSSRTPFKHWLLDHHLGQIVGVLSHRNKKVPAEANPFFCIDLCAGDGVCGGMNQGICKDCTGNNCCSSRLIMKHCQWLYNKGLPVRMLFCEKSPHTFNVLLQSINMYVGDLISNCRVRNRDARKFRLKSKNRQAVFINCDPNHIEDMPLVNKLVDSLTPATTLMVTLGCNVHGLKRLNRDRRQRWFDYVDVLVDSMPKWHDAILVELVGDDSQWAYFSRLPSMWAQDHLRTIKRKGDKMFSKGVNVVGLKSDPMGFRKMIKHLFLTKRELS